MALNELPVCLKWAKNYPRILAQLVYLGHSERLLNMSNTPLVDIIPPNGGLVNGYNATLIQDVNVQQSTTNCNESQRLPTQTNGNVPNFHAMSKDDLAALAALQFKQLQDVQAKYAESQHKYNYLLQALGNKALPEQARKAQIALKLDADYNKPDADGWYTPYLQGLAKYVGASDSTLQRGVHILAECSNVIEIRKSDQPGKSPLQIRHIVPLATQSKIIPIAPVKKHGGDHRITCPNCHSEDIIEKKKHICRSCGSVVKDFDDIAVNKLSGEPLPIHPFVTPDDAHLQDASQEQESQEQETDGEMSPVASCKLNYVRTHSSLLASCADSGATHLQDASGELTAFDELKALPIWACHRAKRPYDAKNDAPGSSTDESSWSSYEQAQAKYERSQAWAMPYDGIGFMCNGMYTVADFDHCIDSQGVLSDFAQEQIAAIDSYAELSQSGTGVHCIARATIPSGVHRAEIELYCSGRFIVFTGKQLPGTPGTIENRQELFSALHAQYKPVADAKQASLKEECVRSYPFTDETMEQVKNRMFHSRRGVAIKALWNGDASPYPKKDGSPDNSRADAALCNHLAYWTDCNVEMIDSLFRQSGLMRSKWETHPTYAQETIEGAIAYVLSKRCQKSQEQVAS